MSFPRLDTGGPGAFRGRSLLGTEPQRANRKQRVGPRRRGVPTRGRGRKSQGVFPPPQWPDVSDGLGGDLQSLGSHHTPLIKEEPEFVFKNTFINVDDLLPASESERRPRVWSDFVQGYQEIPVISIIQPDNKPEVIHEEPETPSESLPLGDHREIIEQNCLLSPVFKKQSKLIHHDFSTSSQLPTKLSSPAKTKNRKGGKGQEINPKKASSSFFENIAQMIPPKLKPMYVGTATCTRYIDDHPDFPVYDLEALEDIPGGITTIMLRNIPNKYSQKMLLNALMPGFGGLFDFFYLPIDFRNKCNVGYAFLNFVHPYYTLLFRRRFHGHKLSAFKSSKVCEVSEGRVQGLEANIEHYRNSAVMSESVDMECKPKLFSNGQEVPFPAPDGPLPFVKLRPQKS